MRGSSSIFKVCFETILNRCQSDWNFRWWDLTAVRSNSYFGREKTQDVWKIFQGMTPYQSQCYHQWSIKDIITVIIINIFVLLKSGCFWLVGLNWINKHFLFSKDLREARGQCQGQEMMMLMMISMPLVMMMMRKIQTKSEK